MVCVKTKESNHDFKTEGIEVVINEDKVTAKETSLGADQGVGLAIMLTIMENKNLQHPDIEFLFTIEEETTFKGAITFPYNQVESKRMINLDNCKDDSIFIGSNGDICNEFSLECIVISNNLPSYKITIDNLVGGNSSENISLSKNNAIMNLIKLLKNKNIYLSKINGGKNENDIANFCEVIIHTKLNLEKEFKKENIKIEKINNFESFSKKDTKRIIKQVLKLKSGYLFGKNVSANLGVIKTEENKVKMQYIIRSQHENKLESRNKKIKRQNNCIVKEIYRDEIWQPLTNSKLLNQYKEVYFQDYKEYPKEEIYPGTIECAAIKDKIKNLDIISIGSNIKNFHTTKETTCINSWLKTYKLLIKFLQEIE